MKTYPSFSLLGLVSVIALIGSPALRAADAPAPPFVPSTKAVGKYQDPAIVELRTRLAALEKRNAALEADVVALERRLVRFDAVVPAIEKRVAEVEDDASHLAKSIKDFEGHTHSYQASELGLTTAGNIYEWGKRGDYAAIPMWTNGKIKHIQLTSGPMELDSGSTK